MADEKQVTAVDSAVPNTSNLGEFPFPLSDTAQESKYLTWVRDHSSYLAVGGFLNWANAVAAYIRGVLGNLLVLMPYLIVLGSLLGFFHAQLLKTPLQLSKFAFGIGISILLLYFGWDIGRGYSKKQSPNSVSSKWLPRIVQYVWRWLGGWKSVWNPFWLVDRFLSNLTAWVLIFIGFALLIDISPHVIEFVRKWSIIDSFGIKECLAAVLAAVSAAGGLLQFLPKSKVVHQKIIVVLAAILSFGLVWGITLRIANYVYYGLPPHGFLLSLPLACVVILLVTQLVRILNSRSVGWIRKLCAILLLAVCGVFGLAAAALTSLEFNYGTTLSSDALGTISRPLARLVNGVDSESPNSFEGTELTSLLNKLAKKKVNLDGEGPQLFAGSTKIENVPNVEIYLKDADGNLEKVATFADQLKKQIGLDAFEVSSQPLQFTLDLDGSRDEKERIVHQIKSGQFLANEFGRISEGKNLTELPYVGLQPTDKAKDWQAELFQSAKSKEFWQAVIDNLKDIDETESKIASVGELYQILEFGWLEPRVDALPELGKFRFRYYERTGLFLEEAERLGEIEEREKIRLLKHLSSTAVNELLKVMKKDDLKGPKFEEVVLNRLLYTKLSAIIDDKTAEQVLKTKDKSRLEVTDQMRESAQTWIKETRLPSSLAAEYLTLTRRKIEIKKYSSISAPDAALNGPQIIRASFAADKQKITRALENALLRVFLSKADPKIGHDFVSTIGSQWLERRNITKPDLENLLYPAANGTKLSFKQIVDVVLSDEKAVNKEGILKWCRLSSDAESNFTSPEGETKKSAKIASRMRLIELALTLPEPKKSGSLSDTIKIIPKKTEHEKALHIISELFDPQIPSRYSLDSNSERGEEKAKAIYLRQKGTGFSDQELAELAAARYIFSNENNGTHVGSALRRIVHGKYGNLKGVENVGEELFRVTWLGKLLVLFVLLSTLVLFCSWFVNPNSTSLHRFYKRKLSDAFVIRSDGESVEPEGDIRLSKLCDYDSGSTAPYLLINVAMNMQGSDIASIRDRNAEFFFFSKEFVGAESTGYISTSEFESAASDLTVATAMAVSAGAAAPNMGQYTIKSLSFLLTMVNLRLGYWIPNPRKLAASLPDKKHQETESFEGVFKKELREIAKRRTQANCERADDPAKSVNHQLLGLSLSGGGIRSAAVNIGNTQVLEEAGLFKEIDYLSTVSGGGYLGASLSTLMRTGNNSDLNHDSEAQRSSDIDSKLKRAEIKRRKRWRPRARLLIREMFGQLHSESEWVNVSDGGHVENLGAFELLRRRCELIVVGEGESDAGGGFPGLSNLMRLAEIDLGVEIEFPKGSLEKLILPANFDQLSGEALAQQIEQQRHFAVARIKYPRNQSSPEEFGYLLYVRSSLRGDEDQIMKSYKKDNPDFPHESTADQFFNEGQFEAYRRLGNKMMKEALTEVLKDIPPENVTYFQLKSGLDSFWTQESS